MADLFASTVIEAPIEEVFAVVSDLSTHPSWAADGLTLEQTGDTSWKSIAKSNGVTLRADIDITAVEPDRRFEFVVTDASGMWRHQFEFDAVPEGCRVTRTVKGLQMNPRQRLQYRILRPLVGDPGVKRSLRRLAARFE